VPSVHARFVRSQPNGRSDTGSDSRGARPHRWRGHEHVPSPVGPYNIWEQVLARIEEAIQPHTYLAFFRDTVLVSDDGVIIRVRVRSSDAGEWIAKHHADALREALG
jgi:hypothetical protein